jgi:transcriptional regulator with XRE-family HTH domain
MAKNFRELEAKMSPGARARSDAKTQKMIEEMALNELRQAMGITQERLAKALRINQAGVSKFESRSDIFVSTLRKPSRRWVASWRFAQSFPLAKCGFANLAGLLGDDVRVPDEEGR